MSYSSPEQAFEKAMKTGRLSADKKSPNYVGNFMYMGDNKDAEATFKHSILRMYLNTDGTHVFSVKTNSWHQLIMNDGESAIDEKAFAEENIAVNYLFQQNKNF